MPSYPAVISPDKGPGDTYFSKLTLQGEAFGQAEPKDILIFLREKKVDVSWDSPDRLKRHQVYARLDHGAKQMDIWLPWSSFDFGWRDYHGVVPLRVAIKGDLSDPHDIIISGFKNRWWPATIAAITTLLILSVPILLINAGRSTYRVDGKRYGVLAALFLEKETDTYSLSRFQFYMWTVAAIFGYIVLTIAQSLVQGRFVFADIPKGLPGIIFISAATTVASQGVTATRGAKGAGPIYPSLADFVTSGGVIVVERFQFFVWTILGVFTFLFLVIFHDPATLTDLPKVPDGFLALMGLSSFGYIGGKLSRKPGPVVDNIIASVESLILKFQGRKLSSNCSIRVDGNPVRPGDMERPVGSEPDDRAQPAELFKTVIVTIKKPEAKWLKGGRHSATIINPDGQEAQWIYSLPSKPVIKDPIDAKLLTDGTLTLRIDGGQLSRNASLMIDGTAVTVPDIDVSPGADPDEEFQTPGQKPELAKSLTVTIAKPDDKWKGSGTHNLTLTNPDHNGAKGTYQLP